eukprot:SM000041S15532  [mRNA]  locus=s41:663980:665312:- [translate_table: standard]
MIAALDSRGRPAAIRGLIFSGPASRAQDGGCPTAAKHRRGIGASLARVTPVLLIGTPLRQLAPCNEPIKTVLISSTELWPQRFPALLRTQLACLRLWPAAVLAAAALLAVAGLALSIAAVERPGCGAAGFRGAVRSPDCRIHDHVNRSVEADLGAVSADESRCSEIGLDVLKDGGNAVDAAVATAFCQGVVGPQASGIGGGAFMLVRMADGTAEAIDMREEAPAAASENMYKHDRTAAVSGGLASGTPGELAGLHVAWERHGRLPWARLVRPAAELAEGFEVRPFLAASLESSKDVILAFPSVRDVFAPGGRVLRAGDMCRWPKLAGKLTRQRAPGLVLRMPARSE